MGYKGKLLVPVLAGALGLLALPTGSARADSTSPLPQLIRFHQMLVDNSAGYVFLSEGLDSEQLLTDGSNDVSGVVVTNLSGGYVTTLDAGNGVEGLALSPDGKTLYAALAPDSAVAVIDVTSITPTTTSPAQRFFQLGAWEVPFDLAIQSGRLWVSFNPMQDSLPGESKIGYFSLSQVNPSFVVPRAITDAWYSAPNLAADPSGSGILLASLPQSDPADVASYDVAGGTITTLAAEQELRKSGNANCSNASDLAVVPGGSEVIMACGWPYAHYYYSTANLGLVGGYGSTYYPSAVAMAPSKGLLAVGASDPYSPDIYIYRLGGTAPLNAYSFGNSSTNSVELAPRGLALSPSGSALYALTTQGSTYTLHIFGQPAQPKTALTLAGPSPAFTGSITLHGTLTLASGAAPAGTTITVTRAGGGNTVTLPPVTTGAGGKFTVTNTITATGSYTYRASYSSPTGTTVATTSLALNVALNTTKLTLTGSAHPNGSVTLNGTLSFDGTPAPAGTTVTITRKLANTAVSTTLPPVTTTASGTFTVTDQPGMRGTYIYTAHYKGSATSGPATASVTVTVTK